MPAHPRAYLFAAGLMVLGIGVLSVFIARRPASTEPPVEPMPHRYLLPQWHTASIDVEPLGEGRYRLTGTVRAILAPFEDLELFFETSEGIMVIGQPESWQGRLGVGEVRSIRAEIALRPGADYGYVTLAYDYDFPEREIVDYIISQAASEYPDEDLRAVLLSIIRDEHRGRKQDGMTERIEGN